MPRATRARVVAALFQRSHCHLISTSHCNCLSLMSRSMRRHQLKGRGGEQGGGWGRQRGAVKSHLWCFAQKGDKYRNFSLCVFGWFQPNPGASSGLMAWIEAQKGPIGTQPRGEWTTQGRIMWMDVDHVAGAVGGVRSGWYGHGCSFRYRVGPAWSGPIRSLARCWEQRAVCEQRWGDPAGSDRAPHC